MPGPCTRAVCVASALVLSVLAGPVRAQPAPRPLSILDVPFISQSEALCGGAAAAMVLRYWGERGLDAESFSHLVDRSAAGIRTNRLVDDLRARGWNAVAGEGTDDGVSAELARGRPVLTLIEDRPGTFHYVVVVAATPQAVVFHDPARAPFRVMTRENFTRRWAAADRWMAIVVPGAAVETVRLKPDTTLPAPIQPDTTSPAPIVPEPVDGESDCAALMARGIRHAQSNELDAAERSLSAALSCGGSAPMREMAGLRLLQRRWPEVSEMASAALAEDPGDAHAWELLATSRFVQDDPAGALDAWNRIDRPRVDLVSVGGLTRTRQRVVERLLSVTPQTLLTPSRFAMTRRRLRELPSAVSTRLELVPASGLAELRAHVVERSLLPAGTSSYVTLGLLAAARSEVGISTGSVTGGGERISASWRFWPERPRLAVEIAAPAPWGGIWALEAFGERQPFAGGAIAEARRAGAATTISSWVGPWARVSLRGGVDAWDGLGSFGLVSGGLRLASPSEHVVVGVEGSGWSGSSRFASVAAAGTVRSRTEHRGRVFIARAGAAAASERTPADIWFAGDTGRARGVPLRAHAVIESGGLRVDRIGRHIVHLSGEARQWWSTPLPLRLGAAVFADSARVGNRLAPGARGDVDVGLGVRLGVPGLEGVFRVDLANGLRDGATAVSFVYEP